MSIERFCQELNITVPPQSFGFYNYTWVGSAKSKIRLGVNFETLASISSWGGLLRRNLKHVPYYNLTYEELKESFLKYVAVLRPGEIPALDHLIIRPLVPVTPASFKIEEPEIKAPIQILKPGPTHDWIGALYRPYVPVI